MAVSLARVETPTPFGTLFLDPAGMFILYQAVIPSQKIMHLTMQAPAIAPLTGLQFHLQGAIVGGSGLYLTNAVTITIF